MSKRVIAALAISLGLLGAVCAHRPSGMAKSGYASVNGIQMYYESRGKGSPVVLLHGGGNTIQGSFSKQIPFLAKSHHVIGIEQVGHGHTEDRDALLSYTQMTEDTAELLRQLGVSNADVIGWSDGGIIALMLASRHPELVRRAVVSGANISPDGVKPDANAAIATPPPSASEPPETISFSEKLHKLWLYSPTPEELNVEALKQIRARVLVMAGDDDEILLEHTILVYKSIPDAQLCILPGTSHNTFNEKPDLTNLIIRTFLNQK